MKKIKQLTFFLHVLGVITVVTIFMTACNSNQVIVDEDSEEPSSVYETLNQSSSEKFSYNDLVVNKLKMGMTEAQVKEVLGEPANFYDSKEVWSTTTQAAQKETQKATIKETQSVTQTATSSKSDEVMDEKVYGYNDLSLIFLPVDGTYKLCAAASVGDKDIFARGIKVGDSKDKIFDLYYRDADCMNNNLMTSDKATIIGKYLYGNFTIDDLDSVKANDKIQYGVLNYNGYSSYENAQSYIIEFTDFELPYKNQIASYNDDFAQLAFDIDNKGIITGIRWYYYPEN